MTSEEGGDPACWLDRVCEACGRLVEDPDRHACDVSDHAPVDDEVAE